MSLLLMFSKSLIAASKGTFTQPLSRSSIILASAFLIQCPGKSTATLPYGYDCRINQGNFTVIRVNKCPVYRDFRCPYTYHAHESKSDWSCANTELLYDGKSTYF